MLARLVALAGLLLVAGPAVAATISVPGDYAGIQEAVNAANAGDAIQVKGLFLEKIEITGKSDLTISGKAFVDAQNQGLIITNCQRILVSGLTFDDAELDTVRIVGSSDITLTKCVIQNGEAHGIVVENSDRVAIVKCQIHDLYGSGIHMPFAAAEASDGCLLRQNTIFAVNGDGIRAPGTTTLKVEKNKIYGCLESGIFLFELAGAMNARVEGNTITDVQGSGIVIGGNGSNYTRNKISRCFFAGIEAHGIGHFIEGNSITTVGDDGVALIDSDCRVGGNKISDVGFYHDGGFTTGSGVSCEGPGHTIDGNKIKGVRTAGIHVWGADGNTVTNNSVSGSDLDGVLLQGDGNTLAGNKVAKVGEDGFEVNGTGNTVAGNSAKGSPGLDLREVTGDNTYVDNSFGTTNL